jgi:hypothetical protein
MILLVDRRRRRRRHLLGPEACGTVCVPGNGCIRRCLLLTLLVVVGVCILVIHAENTRRAADLTRMHELEANVHRLTTVADALVDVWSSTTAAPVATSEHPDLDSLLRELMSDDN